jgi:hypothetical protein
VRPYTGIQPESLPEPTAPDFQPRLRGMLSFLDYWARDASFGFNRIILGQSPDGSGNPIPGFNGDDFLYLPGRLGGQVAHWLDLTAPYLTINSGLLSTATQNTGTIFRIATSDAIEIFSVGADGATLVNVPQTTYVTGNPVALTLQMNDNTGVSGDNDFFKLRTNGTDVLTVGYFGVAQIDMTADDLAIILDQNSGATSDYMRFNDGSNVGNPRGSVTKLGIDSNGDIYGGSLGSSTLNLFSDNLADSTTGSIRMTATPTVEIRSGLAANTYVPYQFGIGTTGAVQLTMNNARISLGSTSGGATAGFPSVIVDNSDASNASIATVLYKAIRKSGQTGDLFECLDSNGSTLLSAFNSAGAYRLVVGAAVGSVLTSDANGVGSWTALSGLSASFADNLFSLFDNVTPTKIAQFQVSGLPVGTSTFNFPALTAAGTDTLAALGLVQTFTQAQTMSQTDVNVPVLSVTTTLTTPDKTLFSAKGANNQGLEVIPYSSTDATIEINGNVHVSQNAGSLIIAPSSAETDFQSSQPFAFNNQVLVTPGSDVPGLKVNEYGSGATGSLFTIADVLTGAGDVLRYAGLGYSSLAFGLHTGGALVLWPGVAAGTSIGSGGSHAIQSLATAGRNFFMPNVSGTAMVIAGSNTRTNSAAVVLTTIVSTAVNASGGAYQVNLVVANGSTAGDRFLSVALGWTDERGARSTTLVGSYALASTAASQAPFNTIYTVRTTAATAITVTPTFTSGTTGTYNWSLGVTKVV